MRKLSLVLLLTLLLAAGLPVRAAPGAWECTFDFTLSNGGWQKYQASSSSVGNYSGGIGWQSQFANIAPTGNASRLYLEREISATFISSVSVTHQRPNSTNALRTIWTELGGVTTQHFDEVNNTNYAPGTVLTETINATADTIVVRMNASPGNVDIRYTEIVVSGTGTTPFTPGTGISCTETQAYYKPIAAADLDAWGVVEKQNPISEPQDHAIFAYSNISGVNVYSATDGTITSVRRATPNDCDNEFGRGSLNNLRCTFDPPGDISRAIDGGQTPYDEAYTNAWLVTLFEESASRAITYWIDQADLYVTEGQTITGGCLIGKTMKIDANELPSRYLEQGLSIVNVRESGTIIDAIEEFSVEPDAAAPCNQDEQYEECLGDVQLRDPSAWSTSGDVVFLNPGFGLGSGEEYISTTMNLDGTEEPELIVRAKKWVGSNGKLEMTLGQTVITQTLTSNFDEYGTVSITGGTHEADGQFYTVRVKNLSGGYIDIQSICVRFTKDDEGDPIPDLPDIEDPPNEQQEACIFADNSFDNGTGGWSVSGSVEGATGEIRVPHNQTFSQGVDVATGSYTITVVAAIWHYDSYSPDDENTSSDVTLAYDYPVDSSFTTIQTKTFGQFAENNNLVTFQVAYNPGSDQSGTFTFRVTIASAPTGVRGVAIRAVCIDDGDYDDGDDGQGGGDDTPFEESCDPIAQPSGSSDFGVWLRWHWAKLNGFYRCELMILLNSMYKLMRDSWLTTSWSIRWSQEVTRQSLEWFAEDWTFWLGGHLSNIVNGNTVVINAPEGDCNNLFCVLDRLINDLVGPLVEMIQQIVDLLIMLVTQTFNLLFVVATALITILINLVTEAFELLALGLALIMSLLNAWNTATPISIPGMPSCAADSQSNPFCVGIWIMDNTVFSPASPGSVIVPILIGIGSIHLLLWVAEKIRSVIISVGANA